LIEKFSCVADRHLCFKVKSAACSYGQYSDNSLYVQNQYGYLIAIQHIMYPLLITLLVVRLDGRKH
jgi:hypothetical protein